MTLKDNMPGKLVSASRVSLAQLMGPEHANNFGNVHGGAIMKLMDEAGALACIRHCQHRVVTVAVDMLTFHQPIRLGDLVTLTAEVSYVGHTSMEAEVHVVAEDLLSGECTFTNDAYFVYVGLDETGKPVSSPKLIPETEYERIRMNEGEVRQKYRISQSRRNPKDSV